MPDPLPASPVPRSLAEMNAVAAELEARRESLDVIEQLAAERAALRDLAAEGDVLSCELCGKPIDNPMDAQVFKRRADAPSIVAHHACAINDLVTVVGVGIKYGAKSLRALGYDS